MPYCLNCRDEFEDWVEVCPDCGISLVDELPNPLTEIMSDEPLVRIATAPNEAIAHMWSGILEDNGIHCLLKSENLRAAMYVLPFNTQYEIQVLASEAVKATEILTPFVDE